MAAALVAATAAPGAAQAAEGGPAPAPAPAAQEPAASADRKRPPLPAAASGRGGDEAQSSSRAARRRSHAAAGPSSPSQPAPQVDLVKAAVALAATLARHADKLGKGASAAAAAAAAASGPPVKPLVALPNGWALLWGDEGPLNNLPWAARRRRAADVAAAAAAEAALDGRPPPPPPAAVPHLAAGAAAERALDVRAAIASYEAALAAAPGCVEALGRLSKAWSDVTYLDEIGAEPALSPADKRAANEKAVDLCLAASEAAPSSGLPHAACCVAMGRLALFSDNRAKARLAAAARGQAAAAVGKSPKSDLAHHLMGRWHWEMAQLPGVVRTLARLVYGASLEPGSFEAALAHYRTAVELAPARLVHRVEVGRSLARAGRADEALAELQAALALPVEDINAHLQAVDARIIMSNIRGGVPRAWMGSDVWRGSPGAAAAAAVATKKAGGEAGGEAEGGREGGGPPPPPPPPPPSSSSPFTMPAWLKGLPQLLPAPPRDGGGEAPPSPPALG